MAQVEKPGWDDVVCAGSNQVSSPIGDDVAMLGLDRGEDTAREDLLALLGQLREAGLIEVR